MKRFLVSLSLGALLFISCTSSKRISYLVEPEAKPADQMGINLAEYEEKYGEYDGVYLLSENIIEHSGSKENMAGALFGNLSSNWNYLRITRRRYIVFNPDATWLTTFNLGGKPDKMYLHVITPDGEVRKYGVADLEKEKVSDGLTIYRFIYPDIVKGTIIEEAYENSYTVKFNPPPLEHEIPLEFSIPCEKVKFTFAYPQWWSVQVKKNSESGEKFYKDTLDEANGKMIISYEKDNLPALEWEPYAPTFKEAARYIQLKVNKLTMASMTYEAPKDWQDHAKRYREYFRKIGKKNRYEIEAVAKQITAECTDDRDKVEKICKYIDDEIDLSFSRGNTAKVFETKEGDATEICELAREMLEAVDIPAEILLVHSAEDGYMDGSYISYRQLQVLAVRVQVGEEYYVLFPYIEGLPIDHTPDFFQNQPAMVISDKIQSLFWTVPPGNRADNTQDEDYDLTIDENGLISVKETRTLRGVQAFDLRQDLKDLKDDELEKAVKKLLTYTDGDIDLQSYEITDLKEYRQPLKIDFNYTVDNLVMLTPEEAVFQTSGLFSPISNQEYKFDPVERINDIKVSYDEKYNKNITIHFPESWQVATALDDIARENIFGGIASSYVTEGNDFIVKQHLILNKTLQPRDKITEFIDLVGNTSKLHVPTVIFKINRT